MAGIYIDTSALGRVLLAEPDAPAIQVSLASYEHWWSSTLLGVELGRLARRHSKSQHAVRLLAGMNLLPISETLLQQATAIDPPEVRSLDAIHLATAVELHSTGTISAAMTFDRQLDAGLKHHTIQVLAPAI